MGISPETLVPLLVLVPLLGALGLAVLPNPGEAATRAVALIWSLVALGVALGVVCYAYRPVRGRGLSKRIG